MRVTVLLALILLLEVCHVSDTAELHALPRPRSGPLESAIFALG